MLVLRVSEGTENIDFMRVEFLSSTGPEGDLHVEDDALEGYNDGSITSAVSRPGRWQCDPGAISAASQNPPTYNGAPSWSQRGCTSGDSDFSKTKPGTRVLAEYLKNHFEGAKSYGGYNCRPNTANTSQLSVHGTGRAIDLFVPRHNRQADNDLGDPIGTWLLEHSSEDRHPAHRLGSVHLELGSSESVSTLWWPSPSRRSLPYRVEQRRWRHAHAVVRVAGL